MTGTVCQGSGRIAAQEDWDSGTTHCGVCGTEVAFVYNPKGSGYDSWAKVIEHLKPEGVIRFSGVAP